MQTLKGLLGMIAVGGAASVVAWAAVPPPQEAYAAKCNKKYEYVSGMKKTCVYDCKGSDYSITVRATQLCPLTIDR